jgi:hypothetical protein
MIKKIIKIILILTVSMIGTACDNSKWYDFGNGRVNLNNVKLVLPEIEVYTITDKKLFDENKKNIFPLNRHYIQELKKSSPENIKNLEFYLINFRAYIRFDEFNLELYKSEEFVKKPGYYVTDRLLNAIREQGASSEVINSLKKNNGIKYNKNEFLNMLEENSLDADHPWVKNDAVKLALPPALDGFLDQIELLEDKSENIRPPDKMNEVFKKIEDSIETYNSIFKTKMEL